MSTRRRLAVDGLQTVLRATSELIAHLSISFSMVAGRRLGQRRLHGIVRGLLALRRFPGRVHGALKNRTGRVPGKESIEELAAFED